MKKKRDLPSFESTPLSFLLALMKDNRFRPEDRINAALTAAPYFTDKTLEVNVTISLNVKEKR